MNRHSFTRRTKHLFSLAILMTLSLSMFAQRNVSGKVTDETGQSLVGATVLVKGTTSGTATDINGAFTVNLPEGSSILEISYTGYQSMDVSAEGQDNISIQLEAGSEMLDQVVVVGYGRQKKSQLTGAISSIEVDEIQNLSNGQLQSSLQGRSAGVSILPNSGSPGSGFKVRIRGTGSNGNAEPLYIVDGMRTKNISFLSAGEVENIEILKDAAAAAIYGAEGANGVVIITTKSGKSGESTITYSAQYGIQNLNTNLQLMDASQHAAYMQEAGVMGRTDSMVQAAGINTNWLDEVFEASPMQNHTLSFAGGNEKSNYYVQGSYFDQDGMVVGDRDKFTRTAFRANINSKVNDRLNVGVRINYTNSNRKGIAEDSEFGGVLGNAIMMDPLTPVTYSGAIPSFVQDQVDAGKSILTDADGNVYGISEFVNGEIYNPVAAQHLLNGSGNTTNRLMGSMFAELKLVEGLTFTSRLGVDNEYGRFHNWTPSYFFTTTSQSNIATVEQTHWNNSNIQWENYFNFNKSFGLNNISVVAGTSAYSYSNSYVLGAGSGLIVESDNFGYLGSVQPGNEFTTANGGESQSNLLSYFGRVSYDYAGKYLLSVVLRRDGSSLLADGNKWGTFPSASLGWIVSKEDFFPSSSALNFMKVRASWGQNGSLANLSPGAWKSAIGFGNAYPDGDGNLNIAAEPTILSNPELTWETSQQLDFGIDLGLFNDRVALTVDYFQKETKNLLNQGVIPNFVGNNAPTVNLGDVSNKGWEVELTYRNSFGDLDFELGANMTRIQNEVTALDENLDFAPGAGVGVGWTATAFETGLPAWYFRGYQTDGILQSEQDAASYMADFNLTEGFAAGDPRVVDVNKDGAITPADQTFIGSPHPDMLFGVRLAAEYKGFDFTMFMQGSVGNDILLGYNRTDRASANKPAFFYEDRWTEGSGSNDWFRANSDNIYAYNSDFMIFDGSYLRIKQMQLGYNFDQNSVWKGARVYVSLEDFFTFTKYVGMDPEVGSGDDRSQGIDRGVYPLPKKIMFGANLSF
jgi:TonB-linked SusC/RagA family outer membrane protein